MENIYKATHSDTEESLIENAVGKISNEFVYLYPPGSPILAPGELITKEIVKLINDYKASGLNVEGLHDTSAEFIRIIKEEFRRINLTKGYYHLNV